MKKILYIFLIASIAIPLFAKTSYDDERIFTRAKITKIEKIYMLGAHCH